MRCFTKNHLDSGANPSGPDYHYMCQFNNGKWGERLGVTQQYRSNVSAPNGTWINKYYNSPTIYFAISKKQWK